jgi:alkylhydroperoxidase/carboxymuconolactone decarboxylase family protein YurZ
MSTSTAFDEVMRELAEGGGPVMETLAQMNTGLGDSPEIDERTILLMRFSALVALDAPAQSYLVTLALAERAGITPQAVQAALAALAPVVGGPRVVSAATKVMQAVHMAGA